MSIVVYEADQTAVTVDVPSNAPVLTWAAAAVRRGNTTISITASIITPRTVVATIPKDALLPGLWEIQVRAGDSEPNAQTVYDGKVLVKDSI